MLSKSGRMSGRGSVCNVNLGRGWALVHGDRHKRTIIMSQTGDFCSRRGSRLQGLQQPPSGICWLDVHGDEPARG
uniref:Uncharacterized protein n=1 Tax=Bionectria ochroleuca TaxID=29856 RepID=A0A0B7JRY2_BIOOC